MSIRILTVVAACCALLPAAARAESPVLVATVGPGYTIGLADAAGKPVDVVTAGHYTLVVHDLSPEHNFVPANKPDGLRLRVETTVEFVGDKTFDVDLGVGRYGYACSPHWEVMNGSLAANAAPTAPAPTVKALRATVPAAGALSLSAKRVSPGRYRV